MKKLLALLLALTLILSMLSVATAATYNPGTYTGVGNGRNGVVGRQVGHPVSGIQRLPLHQRRIVGRVRKRARKRPFVGRRQGVKELFLAPFRRQCVERDSTCSIGAERNVDIATSHSFSSFTVRVLAVFS